MARKKTTRDFAIPMDEFHPRPSTAAAFADRKANDACQEHLRTDLKRVEAQLALTTPERRAALGREKQRIVNLLAQCEEDRKRIDEIIAEAKVA